jgi:MFS family permease
MTTTIDAAGGQAETTDERTARIALISACLGWMFDAFDLQLFTVIVVPCVADLIGSTKPSDVAYTAGLITCCKLLAWGVGGVIFGVVADRFGRTRTMIITVLAYSLFTAASAFAQSWQQLALFQALAGVGIGGEWAAGAALVAETATEKSRPRSMQIMQMSFAGGFFLAALVNLVIGPMGWRWVLAVGVVPSLLTLFIRRFVPEPERWVRVQRQRSAAALSGVADRPWSTFRAIFARDLRRHTIVGVLIAATMMIGSVATTSLIPIWIHELASTDPAASIKLTSQVLMLMNVGAVLGYGLLICLTSAIGRRWSYFLVVVGSACSVLFMFTQIRSIDGLLCYIVVHGFFAIGGFGAFAAYLPELFPTRVRATGQGFCWNMGRLLTAGGPFVSGSLVGVFGSITSAAASMAVIYLVGMIAIWFGPETKGKPLAD